MVCGSTAEDAYRTVLSSCFSVTGEYFLETQRLKSALGQNPELTSHSGLLEAGLVVRQCFKAYLLLLLLSVSG